MLDPLTPKLLYNIAKEEMKGHLSSEAEGYKATKTYGFDKNHRTRIRQALCLSTDRIFDQDAVNVCKSMWKQGIFDLLSVTFRPENGGNVDYITGEELANRVIKVLEEKGYELF